MPASLKKNEGYVYKISLNKRKKIKPKYQINDLVRTADIKRTFSKVDTTNWTYKLYKTLEIINDTIPSYKIDDLKEGYNESLLKKTDLLMKENEDVMKKLNITYIKSNCRCQSLLIETNLFVRTKAYPLTSLGTIPLNINSPLFG